MDKEVVIHIIYIYIKTYNIYIYIYIKLASHNTHFYSSATF